MFEDCVRIFHGYGAVDNVLEECERIGAQLKTAIASWSLDSGKGKQPAHSTLSSRQSCHSPLAIPDDVLEEGALSLRSLTPLTESKPKDFLAKQPSILSDDAQLKDYQLLGVNWLRLLYRKRLSCILADEMGLCISRYFSQFRLLIPSERFGKNSAGYQLLCASQRTRVKGTSPCDCPVGYPSWISMSAADSRRLRSSTLENWVREFARFAPTISVQTYYGGKDDRPMLRQRLSDTQKKKLGDGWEVLITTYNLATGDDKDRKFFRRTEWDVRCLVSSPASY